MRWSAGGALLLAMLAQAPARAGATWQIAGGDVRVECPLTVGGSFEARTSALSGSLTAGGGAFGGSLVVDLDALDTGIGLRNRHMRDRYLEVHRGEGFERAVLTGLTLAAPDVAAAGGRSAFHADLLVHGVTRRVEGEAQVAPRGTGMQVQASFPLSLTEFDIASPRYLGVGVRDRVTVRVSFVATPVT